MSSELSSLKKQLELEQQTKELLFLPEDFYYNITKITHDLQRSINSQNTQLTNNLIIRQITLIKEIVSDLVRIRLEKASTIGPERLLPEEAAIFHYYANYDQVKKQFIIALGEGKQSLIEFLRVSELKRKVVVKFIKQTAEMTGPDLSSYGPFEVGDVATIPWLNAKILIAEGNAKLISVRNSFE